MGFNQCWEYKRAPYSNRTTFQVFKNFLITLGGQVNQKKYAIYDLLFCKNLKSCWNNSNLGKQIKKTFKSQVFRCISW